MYEHALQGQSRIRGADALSRVSPSDSPHERRAERVAERATRTPPAPRRPSPSSQGATFDDGVRDDMEARLGHDFSRVRIHAQGSAAHAADLLGARAFVFGTNIVFGSGEHRPDTESGRHLLVHELAHVADTGGDRAAGILLARRPQCVDDRLTREQFLEGVAWLEERGAITTEEATSLRGHVPDSRRARCHLIDSLERRAQRGRAGGAHDPHGRLLSRHLIANFSVAPRTIHTDHGEAARVSFDATSMVDHVEAAIIKYETSSELPDARFFHFSQGPGHKTAVWDGTFTGSRRSAPEPGTYRVRVWASDTAGNHEEVFEQIVVRNDAGSTVLPRTESGLALRSLRFDGHVAVLSDEGGNEIRARAVSGERRGNPHNTEHRDLTDPRFQTKKGGPIPAGTYFIDGNAAQMPEIVRGRLRYPSGATARGWGPFRAALRPSDPGATHGRSEFFFHLDVQNDGTAGCIGILPSDEARFNQMMALIMRIPTGQSLRVEVSY